MSLVHKHKHRILKMIIITFAAVLYSIGVSLILDPNNLAPGGVTGLSIIINRLTGLETGTLILLLNIPIMIIGLWKLGWKMIVTTIYTLIIISASANFLSQFPPFTTEVIPAIMAGSCICGASIGIIFKCGATTGGTDIIVKILRLRFKHLRTGMVFFLLDMVIVMCAGFVFEDFNLAIYALIAVIVMNFVLDAVLYGRDEAKMIFIISDHSEEISKKLLVDLNVGVTYLRGSGAYHKREKNIILCVMKKSLAPKAEEVIKETDGNAFMIVSSASEIFGEGYKNIFADRL